MIFCIFYEDNNLFLHQSYFKKPTLSQINLVKNAKSNFLNAKVIFCYWKSYKNTESAQLWFVRPVVGADRTKGGIVLDAEAARPGAEDAAAEGGPLLDAPHLLHGVDLAHPAGGTISMFNFNFFQWFNSLFHFAQSGTMYNQYTFMSH